MSAIQPSDVPPNVKFYIDDVEDMCIGNSVYNYIHARFLCSFIQNPAAVIHRTFRYDACAMRGHVAGYGANPRLYSKLKPQGWLELQELDHTIHCDDGSVTEEYPVQEYCEMTSNMTKRLRGIDVRVAPKLGKMMEDAGYRDVQHVKYKVPIGEWVKENGKGK